MAQSDVRKWTQAEKHTFARTKAKQATSRKQESTKRKHGM